jgi:hypothetical protein
MLYVPSVWLEVESIRTIEYPRETGELESPAYLSPMETAQLDEARDFDIGSVTDATTRTLDQVTIERK